MKKIALVFLSIVAFASVMTVDGQQLPDYTQYPSNLFQFNPAYTGTKGTVDARLQYRRQWVGYDGAPTTQFAGISSRLWKGRIGIGATLYKDVTGPTERSNYAFTAAYHLHFPDVEFSVGMGINFNKYTVNGTMMTTHWTNDPVVNYTTSSFDKNKNGMAGLLLYNDRFHFGLGLINMLNKEATFFTADTSYHSKVTFQQHYYFSCGYNFNANPDFVWENNILGNYCLGVPLTLNYNLRVHYREKILAGIGWRLKDAVYLQAGYVFLKQIQFIYSYDVGISKLRKGHNGTHEITLGYRWDFGGHTGGYKNFNNFQRQRYHIF